MAIPFFVGAGTGVAITTGTATVSKTGCTLGDLIVVHYLVRGGVDDVIRSNVINITNLSTLTTNSLNLITNNRDVGLAGGSKHGFYAGRVTADGTCSADFTVGGSGNDIFVRMYQFSGEILGNTDDGIGLFDNEGGQFQSDGQTGTTLSDRAVTTAGPDRLCVSLNSVAGNQALGSFTGETGGDWTEAVAEFASATGATGTIQLQTAGLATAGTINGGSIAITSADWGVISFGIIPAVVATAPSAPQSLVATGGTSVVALSWSAPASNGGSAITGYKIYRSLSTGTETLLASPAGIGTTYADGAVVNGTPYFYKVTAVNAVGESALSNESSATPSAPPVSSTSMRTFRRFYGPTQLGNAAATLYTCPVGTTAVVRHIHVSNPSGSPVDFTLSIGTSAQGTRLWDAIPVPADDVLDHYQDFALAPNEIIQGFSGTAATLNLTIDGYEIASSASAATAIYPSDALFPSDSAPGGGLTCTTTISSGLTAAITNAAAGDVICLNTGNYGALTLSNLSKASTVTIQPVTGATVTIGAVNFDNVNHLRFTGTGGTMNIGGLHMDITSGSSNNLTFDHIVWTAPLTVNQRGSNQAILFDYCNFNNLGQADFEGRISFRGFNNALDAGFTVSNSTFDSGDSDGVQFVGGCRGITIGPGNEFSNIVQVSAAHVDPIQIYDCGPVTVIGNWIHDCSTGIMGGDGGGTGSYIANNVVSALGASMAVYGGSSHNWLVEHNVIYGPGDGVSDHMFFGVGNVGNSSGNIARDNVFANGRILYVPQVGWGTNSYNLNSTVAGTGEISGTPIFVGGATPSTRLGFMLASNSPGYHAGHDGTSMGIIA